MIESECSEYRLSGSVKRAAVCEAQRRCSVTGTKKKIIVALAVVLIFAVLAALFVWHLPENWRRSGVKRWSGWKEGDPEYEITLDLQCWKRIFSHDLLKGTIVIDGEEYVYHAPANDPEHPEISLFVPKAKVSSPDEWLKDYVHAQNFVAGRKHLILIRIRQAPAESDADTISEWFEFFESDF